VFAVLVSTAELLRGWWSAVESTSEDEVMEHRWNDTEGRRSEKNLLQRHSVHHASPWNWTKF